MSSTAVCSIIAMNYAPVARVLVDSVRLHHPEAEMYVLVVDRPGEARRMVMEGATVLTIEDVDFSGDDHRHGATIYDVTEFATSVKPKLLEQLLGRHEVVLYLDPDTRLYSRLDGLVDSTISAGWSVTPHCLAPVPRTGAGPTEQEIMGAGVYNLGYLGVTRKSIHVLRWWWDRLRRHGLVAQPEQMFTDQRWMDLAVPMFSAHIETSTAYNVAYWNLDQRALSYAGDTPMVDGEPLGFFHFSGYDPDEPWWLSKYQRGRARVLMSDNPAYERIFGAYREELLAHRADAGEVPTYGWGDIVPGVPFHKGLRRLYRKELMQAEQDGSPIPPCPFIPDQLDDFMAWLGETDPRPGRDVPRYISAVIDVEPTLRPRFNVVGPHNRADLEHWIRNVGVAVHPTLTLCAGSTARTESHVVHDTGRRERGVDVVGYLTADLGVGQAGRLVAESLRAADVDVSLSAWSRTPSRRGESSAPIHQTASHDTVLLAVNADQLPVLHHELGDDFFRSRRVIGQWFWEVELAPPWFAPAFAHVDELWAPTKFIEQTIRSVAPRGVDVVHMPLPITAPAVAEQSSGIATDRYTFLFVFDHLSVMKRKNPLGLVEAYRRAFPDGGGAALVIKTINADLRTEDAERLRWEVRDRPDITLVEEYRTRGEVARMMVDADCYVSLHRSEGLGLTIAEAMALGKPVIATGYSGNTDFMNDDVSLMVPWTRVPVGDGAENYDPRAEWADPDLDVAARWMRELAANPEKGRSLGSRAREHVLSEFSVARCGERMSRRLSRRRGRFRVF